MRFLVTGKQKYMVPPDVLVGLMDGSIAWAKKYTASKKIGQSWALAGLPGGGMLLNVNSLEELNEIMSEFPLGPTLEMEIQPIVELEEGITAGKKAMLSLLKK